MVAVKSVALEIGSRGGGLSRVVPVDSICSFAATAIAAPDAKRPARRIRALHVPVRDTGRPWPQRSLGRCRVLGVARVCSTPVIDGLSVP
jgi:hypothetical protein